MARYRSRTDCPQNRQRLTLGTQMCPDTHALPDVDPDVWLCTVFNPRIHFDLPSGRARINHRLRYCPLVALHQSRQSIGLSRRRTVARHDGRQNEKNVRFALKREARHLLDIRLPKAFGRSSHDLNEWRLCRQRRGRRRHVNLRRSTR